MTHAELTFHVCSPSCGIIPACALLYSRYRSGSTATIKHSLPVIYSVYIHACCCGCLHYYQALHYFVDWKPALWITLTSSCHKLSHWFFQSILLPTSPSVVGNNCLSFFVQHAVCSKVPQQSIRHARSWPAICKRTIPGKACLGQCQSGYSGRPRLTCLADGSFKMSGNCQRVKCMCMSHCIAFINGIYIALFHVYMMSHTMCVYIIPLHIPSISSRCRNATYDVYERCTLWFVAGIEILGICLRPIMFCSVYVMISCANKLCGLPLSQIRRRLFLPDVCLYMHACEQIVQILPSRASSMQNPGLPIAQTFQLVHRALANANLAGPAA